MEGPCRVLRAAHHGSSNGTQWERLDRLSPSLVIISSNPGGGHTLPDLASSAIFTQFDHEGGQRAVITSDTGTIHIQVDSAGNHTIEIGEEAYDAIVDITNFSPLGTTANPTDWIALLNTRIGEL